MTLEEVKKEAQEIHEWNKWLRDQDVNEDDQSLAASLHDKDDAARRAVVNNIPCRKCGKNILISIRNGGCQCEWKIINRGREPEMI